MIGVRYLYSKYDKAALGRWSRIAQHASTISTEAIVLASIKVLAAILDFYVHFVLPFCNLRYWYTQAAGHLCNSGLLRLPGGVHGQSQLLASHPAPVLEQVPAHLLLSL
jgi:hypothetical protein